MLEPVDVPDLMEFDVVELDPIVSLDPPQAARTRLEVSAMPSAAVRSGVFIGVSPLSGVGEVPRHSPDGDRESDDPVAASAGLPMPRREPMTTRHRRRPRSQWLVRVWTRAGQKEIEISRSLRPLAP